MRLRVSYVVKAARDMVRMTAGRDRWGRLVRRL